MKYFSSFLFLVCLLLVFTSCDKNKVQRCAKTFIYGLNSGDTLELSRMLYDKEYVWSDVELRIMDPDSLSIKKNDNNDYEVVGQDSTRIIISKTKDQFSIKETYNIINVDYEKKRFALNNGLLRNQSGDYETYCVVSSETFQNKYLSHKKSQISNAIAQSNTAKIPPLLENFNYYVLTIDDFVGDQRSFVEENNDGNVLDEDVLEYALGCNMGIKLVLHARDAREQVYKYKSYMSEEQRKQFDKLDKKLQFYINHQSY